MEKALSLPHPVEAASALEPPLARAVFDLLTLGPKVVKARRASALERLRALAQQLAPAEERLHAQLVGEVRAVLKGKRLLLLKRLLDEVGYQDPTLFTELCQGFRLTGQLPSTPEFPQTKLRAATLSRDQLWSTARWAQAVALAHQGSNDCLVDKAVYEATTDERDKGWLTGPRSWSALWGPCGCHQGGLVSHRAVR